MLMIGVKRARQSDCGCVWWAGVVADCLAPTTVGGVWGGYVTGLTFFEDRMAYTGAQMGRDKPGPYIQLSGVVYVEAKKTRRVLVDVGFVGVGCGGL